MAARHIGDLADAFRPDGSDNPLEPQNRYLRLPAFFQPARGGMNQTNQPGDPLWYGTFDTAYTRVGDYICTQGQTYYIASQRPLLPVLCVETNRVISLSRPVAQTTVSMNSYGSYTAASAVCFLSQWPASVLTNNRTTRSEASLPTDVPTAFLNVLLPRIAHIVITTGDILIDELGRNASVIATEETALGWRLMAKLIGN
jgi:hypothetical protein